MNQKTFTQMNDQEIWQDLLAAIFTAAFSNIPRPEHAYCKCADDQPKALECCRTMKLLKDRGMKSMFYFYGARKFEIAKMNFCPECGRPL